MPPSPHAPRPTPRPGECDRLRPFEHVTTQKLSAASIPTPYANASPTPASVCATPARTAISATLPATSGIPPAADRARRRTPREGQGGERAFSLQHPDALKTLIQIARIQSVESSNAIEDVTAPHARVVALIEGEDPARPALVRRSRGVRFVATVVIWARPRPRSGRWPSLPGGR